MSRPAAAAGGQGRSWQSRRGAAGGARRRICAPPSETAGGVFGVSGSAPPPTCAAPGHRHGRRIQSARYPSRRGARAAGRAPSRPCRQPLGRSQMAPCRTGRPALQQARPGGQLAAGVGGAQRLGLLFSVPLLVGPPRPKGGGLPPVLLVQKKTASDQASRVPRIHLIIREEAASPAAPQVLLQAADGPGPSRWGAQKLGSDCSKAGCLPLLSLSLKMFVCLSVCLARMAAAPRLGRAVGGPHTHTLHPPAEPCLRKSTGTDGCTLPQHRACISLAVAAPRFLQESSFLRPRPAARVRMAVHLAAAASRCQQLCGCLPSPRKVASSCRSPPITRLYAPLPKVCRVRIHPPQGAGIMNVYIR